MGEARIVYTVNGSVPPIEGSGLPLPQPLPQPLPPQPMYVGEGVGHEPPLSPPEGETPWPPSPAGPHDSLTLLADIALVYADKPWLAALRPEDLPARYNTPTPTPAPTPQRDTSTPVLELDAHTTIITVAPHHDQPLNLSTSPSRSPSPQAPTPPSTPPPTASGTSSKDAHVCPECGRTYSTSSNLARHRQTHRSPDDKRAARKCPYCDKVYVSTPAFSQHMRTHNQGCKCSTCGKCFSRPWLLQGHIRTHTGKMYPADQHLRRVQSSHFSFPNSGFQIQPWLQKSANRIYHDDPLNHSSLLRSRNVLETLRRTKKDRPIVQQ